MKKTVRSQLFSIIAVIVAVILLAFTLLWFRGGIDDLTEKTTSSYLSENVRAVAAVFKAKLDDQMIMLESQVRYFSDIDLSDYNTMKQTIMATKGIGAFKTIGVANKTGATINYNGRSSGNILLTDYFKEAMKGNTAISRSTTVDEDGDEVLVLIVPIKQGENVTGAVFGTFDKNMLGSLVETVSFAESGTNILAASDGTILARSSSKEIISELEKDLFAIVGRDNIVPGGESIIPFTSNGSEAIAAVTEIGVHDWYFASVIPQTVISEQTETISGYVIIVMLAVSGAFILLFASILFLIKRNESIAKSNERFKLATNESQDIIFDYDYSKRILSLDGNLSNIITSDKNTFTREETLGFFGLIHEEDRSFVNELSLIAKNDITVLNRELRFRCLDGSYSWFRMKATVIRTNDGHPAQVVGSLMNVDEQMNKEFRLIKNTEFDELTGIYNNEAFIQRTVTALAKAGNKDLYALFVIDLDDFRSVNDTLGHAIGDLVLAEAAKKLCLVFSEMDLVGRLGGNKFAVFMILSPEGRKLGMKIIETKAKAICEQLCETYRSRKNEVTLSASVGAAVFPLVGATYDTLFECADAAMYSVKESGKDSYSIVPGLI